MSNSGRPSPSKRLKSLLSLDRISELPEALIVHIISFLSIRDRIKTGALAKSWQFLWTQALTNLYFDWANDDPPDFGSDNWPIKCVNKTLTLASSTGSKIESLGVQLCFDSKYEHDVNDWVRFAVSNKVEIFELDFCRAYEKDRWRWNWPHDDGSSNCYTLPEHLYANSSLRELRIRYCNFSFANTVTISWSSLKKLSIAYSFLSDELIEKIVAGAPALEVLDLYFVELEGTHKLKFSNSALKKLILSSSHDWFRKPKLEISAPNLLSLEVKGKFRNFKLVGMTSLVEVAILATSTMLDGALNCSLEEATVCILWQVWQVPKLTLGTSVIEEILQLKSEGVCPRLSKCKCLTIIDNDLFRGDPDAIVDLLEICQGIETLTIVMSVDKKQNKSVRYNLLWTIEYMVRREVATYLRIVKIYGFWANSEYTLWFVKFLLKKAKVLQKMIIYLEISKSSRKSAVETEVSETLQKLVSFERSSPDAQIFVYP